jgi:hypothetical protein
VSTRVELRRPPKANNITRYITRGITHVEKKLAAVQGRRRGCLRPHVCVGALSAMVALDDAAGAGEKSVHQAQAPCSASNGEYLPD